jgi:hypothetical protein
MNFQAKDLFSFAATLAVILSLAQLLMIGVGALIIGYLPLVPLKEKTPLSGPIVKTVAAFAIIAFSFYLCRQAVRTLHMSRQSEPANGLTLLNLVVGLGLASYFSAH